MENIYLIELSNDKERFFKIGTTVHRFCRFYEIMKCGYRVNIIYMIFGVEFYEAITAEQKMQGMFKPYSPLNKFGGYTECFKHIDIGAYKNEVHKLISNYSEVTENLEISWR